MNVYEIITVQTDDKKHTTQVEGLVGMALPYAFFVNYNCHGYAKFKIDTRSLKAFDEKLGVIFICLID